jgi:hypothetical protein
MLTRATGTAHPTAAAVGRVSGGSAGQAASVRTAAPRESRVLWIVLALALATIVARAAFLASEPLSWVGTADNDDLMRLLSVRAFLDGQGWFDMRQYRLLPPDGLDMHWSRYVDAGIAGLIALFSAVLEPLQAENLALLVWPTLLLAALVLLTGHVVGRTLGTRAATLAILSLFLWPVVGFGTFAPYRIDHHNVQILMISVMALCLIVPGRPVLLGVWGGLAAAMSLAVGLEMLPVIALTGVILALRLVWAGAGAAAQLVGFSLALCLGSLVLYAGQTAPALWGLPRCDRLSPPYLALAAMAAAVSVALARFAAPLASPGARAAMLLGISAVAVAVLYPMLAPCLRGPYASLPAEAQALIHARITEAIGLWASVERGSTAPVRLVLPALLGAALAGIILVLRMRRGLATDIERRAIGTLLAFAALGLAGTLAQMRMIYFAAPAVPALTGYGLAMLLDSGDRAAGRRTLRRLAAVAAMMATIFLPLLDATFRKTGLADQNRILTAQCRSPAAIATLAALPQGIVLSSLNFGAPILLLTHHAALAAPYHRDPAALLNGIVPFEGDADTLRAEMDRTGATYLFLCRDQTFADGASQADRLARGETVAWLEPVAGVDPRLVVLRRTDR